MCLDELSLKRSADVLAKVGVSFIGEGIVSVWSGASFCNVHIGGGGWGRT